MRVSIGQKIVNHLELRMLYNINPDKIITGSQLSHDDRIPDVIEENKSNDKIDGGQRSRARTYSVCDSVDTVTTVSTSQKTNITEPSSSNSNFEDSYEQIIQWRISKDQFVKYLLENGFFRFDWHILIWCK